MKYRGRSRSSPVAWTVHRMNLWRNFDGNHRVPNVNANTDGDFKFNLGNFENDWNSDNCVVLFCDF